MNRFLFIVTLLVSASSFALNPRLEAIRLEGISLRLPSGYRVVQDIRDNGSLIFQASRGDVSVSLYVRAGFEFNIKSMMSDLSRITNDGYTESWGDFRWEVVESVREMPTGNGKVEKTYVTAFSRIDDGKVYFGFARGKSAASSRAVAAEFLSNATSAIITRENRSLTNVSYVGRKFYFGWGAANNGDPSMMHNEVKYDVQHTHDIFTKDVGGKYIPMTLIGPSTNGTQIRDGWKSLGYKMTAEDMYVQYSSGHGTQGGLAVGVSYKEIRDNALSYPAQEIVILTMACFSGNLVNSFNEKKSTWEDWQSQGRTLFVMASSKASETSSTGPDKDPMEPGGPSGSAGSAFGHALWKALAGQSDGFVDGVKDGYVSLGELEKFTINKTKSIGGHTPQVTGAYTGTLIMNRVPSREFLASLEGGTEGLSDDEIMQRVLSLDAAMRLGN